MKIPKVNDWSSELSDYNLTFVHIKDNNNILAEAISRLKTLDIYRDPLESLKSTATYNTKEWVVEGVSNNIQTLNIYRH